MDQTRPWIIYNSSSDFTGRPWIEVVNTGTCLPRRGLTLEEHRPVPAEGLPHPVPARLVAAVQPRHRPAPCRASEAACHDITSEGTRLYCAALNGTIVFDVSGLVHGRVTKRYITRNTGKKNEGGGQSRLAKPKKKKTGKGRVNGPGPRLQEDRGTRTGAPVFDCVNAVPGPEHRPQQGPLATGWTYLGHVNHVGRDCQPGPGITTTTCNNNTFVPSDEDISVAHEADPTWDGNYMFVTDERGGGVVPPGRPATRR